MSGGVGNYVNNLFSLIRWEVVMNFMRLDANVSSTRKTWWQVDETEAGDDSTA